MGTRFMNRFVDAIECRNQKIRLNRRGTIPILSRHDARRPHERPTDKQNDNDDQNDNPRNEKRINDAPFNKPHTIRTARTVTIPPMSQVAISVVTKASGLVYIEPKLPVQTRYHVRTANGIHEVRPNVKFELVVANFSKNPQRLPKGMTIAYAKRNPLAILTVPDEVSTKLEAILNLPFTKTTTNDSTNNESIDANGPDELTKPADWREAIDLGHIENNEMRTKIITMRLTTERQNPRTRHRRKIGQTPIPQRKIERKTNEDTLRYDVTSGRVVHSLSGGRGTTRSRADLRTNGFRTRWQRRLNAYINGNTDSTTSREHKRSNYERFGRKT